MSTTERLTTDLFATGTDGLLPIADDGAPASSESVAMDLVSWTLRTPYGASPGAPARGVKWQSVRKTGQNADVQLQRVLEAGLRWIVEGEYAEKIDVTVTRLPPRGLAYTIDVTEDGTTRTLEGTA